MAMQGPRQSRRFQKRHTVFGTDLTDAARNLARLGRTVRLVSPRGGDADGDIVAAAAEAAGVEDTPFTFLDRATPSYTAIIERDGWVRVLAIDGVAERVALLQLEKLAHAV